MPSNVFIGFTKNLKNENIKLFKSLQNLKEKENFFAVKRGRFIL